MSCILHYSREREWKQRVEYDRPQHSKAICWSPFHHGEEWKKDYLLKSFGWRTQVLHHFDNPISSFNCLKSRQIIFWVVVSCNNQRQRGLYHPGRQRASKRIGQLKVKEDWAEGCLTVWGRLVDKKGITCFAAYRPSINQSMFIYIAQYMTIWHPLSLDPHIVQGNTSREKPHSLKGEMGETSGRATEEGSLSQDGQTCK